MPQLIDRGYFAAHFPKTFGAPLTSSRNQGFEALFAAWDQTPHFDYPEWLAYAMATAWHETARTMQPVREGPSSSDAEAYAKVTALCKKRGRSNYAERQANGKSYYGRGYVQLTHGYNYKALGTLIGLGDALYDQPDRAMEAPVAAKILLVGLMEGSFTHKGTKLITYFNAQQSDWFAARDLVNGDKSYVAPWTLKQWPGGGKPTGEVIADYGRAFRAILKT